MTIAATTTVSTPAPATTIADPLAAAQTQSAPDTAKPSDPDLSGQFAALSRKEKALAAERKTVEGLRKKYEPLSRLDPKSNLGEFMKQHGITTQDVIEYQLKQGKAPTADDKVQTLEQKIADFEKRQADAEAKSKQERIDIQVQNFKDQIRAQSETDKDKYELINAHGAHDLVFQVCAQYYEENKEKQGFKPLEISRALELVEDNLFNEAKTKYASVNKYKSIFAPTTAATPAIDSKAQAPKPSEPTLTNRGTTPSGASTLPRDRDAAIKAIAAQFDSQKL